MNRKSQNISEPAKTGILTFDLLATRITDPITENSVKARKKVQSSTQIARLRQSARIEYSKKQSIS